MSFVKFCLTTSRQKIHSSVVKRVLVCCRQWKNLYVANDKSNRHTHTYTERATSKQKTYQTLTERLATKEKEENRDVEKLENPRNWKCQCLRGGGESRRAVTT